MTCFTHITDWTFRFVSLPGFSWSAALKHSNARIELFTDVDMYLFVEKSIRGGICQQVCKYAKANNPECGSTYDPNLPTSHICYYDANNLYGYSMSEKLPVGGYEWVYDLDVDTIMQCPDDGDTGYLVEIDFEYPSDIHEKTRDLPLAPDHMCVEEDWLSDYQKEVIKETNIKVGQHHKLLLTCFSRKNYIVHYRLSSFTLKCDSS